MNKGQNWVGGKYIEYMPDPSVDPYEVRPEDGYDCWAETTTTPGRSVVNSNFISHKTDTGEDSKLVHTRKSPKVDTLFSSLFSDASERRVLLSTESKILASTFECFRLYRLKGN